MAKDKLPERYTRQSRPARSPEQREMQMMALAIDLSEKRLRDGTASSAEILFWAKQASPQARLERRNMEIQNELLEAKIAAIKNEEQSNTDYQRVLRALKVYRGDELDDEDTIDAEFKEL